MRDAVKYLHNGQWLTIQQIAELEGVDYDQFRNSVYHHGIEYAVKFYRNEVKPDRSVKKITWRGETKTTKAWAKHFGIHPSTLSRWLRETDMDGVEARTKDQHYRTKRVRAINWRMGEGKGQKEALCWTCEKQIGGCVWSRTLKAKPEGAVFVTKTTATNYDIEVCTECPEYARKPKREKRDAEPDEF